MRQTSSTVKLFLDLDGVLADFDSSAEFIFGMHPREYETKFGSKNFWGVLRDSESFFENLKPMPDAFDLYESVAFLEPTILTGCPHGGWAEEQKTNWVKKWFPLSPLITCRSREKRLHMDPTKINIIIDDWPQHRKLWEEYSGHWIHHVNARQSIQSLQELLTSLNI